MLFKLSLSNIRRSLRDYAIYFFTLIIGVSVFYVFNAVGGQAAMLRLSESRYEIIRFLESAMSVTSVFVACVLGLLIVYASRFLMKRRSREFALYMTLGMSKGRISAILILETVIIGIGSLAVGLLVGIGLSQLMSALVVNLFDADMSAYRFSVSAKAVIKTMICFAVMYLVVMLFNSAVVAKMKLIDLMQAGKRSERIRLRNTMLCAAVFLAAAAVLGFCYYQAGFNYRELSRNRMIACIIAGCICTFLIFWSVAGMLLRVFMSVRNVYHRGLNAFTFRQISSRVNTMVFSMTVICIMLFVTICALASAFSIRNTLNYNLRELCRADYYTAMEYDISKPKAYNSFVEMCSENGYDIEKDFSGYVDTELYSTPEFTLADSFGEYLDEIRKDHPFLITDSQETFIRLSDYNEFMELYGKKKLSLGAGEYILLCNNKSMKKIRDLNLRGGGEINVFGNTLRSKYDECQDGFIDISAERSNYGLFVIPDDAVSSGDAVAECFAGLYSSDDKQSAEKSVREGISEVLRATADIDNYENISTATRIDVSDASIGLSAIVTFLGLYIGLVFLIACGAILALKGLSESVDSTGRYEILRKIGAEEKEISRSLFRQTGIFFLLPLLLAALHAVFGMRFSSYVLSVFGTERIWGSVIATSAMILVIYGGYFLVTYFCSKGIIKDRK